MQDNQPTPGSNVQLATNTPFTPQPSTPEPIPTEPPRPIKPKSHKKLIAIISCCVVSLALIISGVAFAIIHNSPEKVLFDAVSGFLNAKNIELNGKYKIKSTSEYSDLDSIDLDFSGATTGIANASEITATMNFKNSDPLTVTIDETFTDDGVLYLKITNLEDALGKMSESGALGYYGGFEQYFGDLIGEIDGDWWKISVDDVLDGFEGMIAEEDKSKYSETYNCIFNKIKSAKDKNDKLVKLYGENSFLSSEKYQPTDTKSGLNLSEFNNSGDLYKLNFDTEKLTTFLNDTKNIVDADGIAACFNTVTTVEVSDINREDVENLINGLPDVILSIKGWNHELQGVYLASKPMDAPAPTDQDIEEDCGVVYEVTESTEENTDYDASIDSEPADEFIEDDVLPETESAEEITDCISYEPVPEPVNDYDMYMLFSYPASVNISTPNNTKSISDVVKIAIHSFQTMLTESFSASDDYSITVDTNININDAEDVDTYDYIVED